MTMSRSVLLRTRNVSDKRCRENPNTHFVFSNLFSFEYRTVYEIMWKNMVEPVRSQMTTWLMRFSFWLRKATNTHSVYIIHSRCSHSLWNVRSRDRTPVDARFSVNFKTWPGALPTSYTKGNGSLSR